MSVLPRRSVPQLAALLGVLSLLIVALLARHTTPSSAITVSFASGTLVSLTPHPTHPTSMAFGPDGRLYVTTETSIRAFTLSPDGTHVTGSELIASGLDYVLGLAFDPTAPPAPVTFYVSRQEPDAPEGYQGTITKYTGPSWSHTDVITGLPTSQPYLNHMTNGIAFDSAGRLYIAQGADSNAGLAAPGGTPTYWHETPLSGAILVADIHANGFDGAVSYSPSGPPNDDDIDQTSGGVSVFAPGLRNPYDLVLHSNGHIYATDNGPIGGAIIGMTSLTCEQDGGSVNQSDELNLIAQGNYYGFPNRNRGRSDPRQCTYRDPLAGSGADFTAPISILPAHCSCDGLAEYTSDAFGGAMQGDLIIAELGPGAVGRIQLSSDGTGVVSVSTLASGFNNPLDLVAGPTGIIYVAEYGGEDIAYLAPQSVTPGSATPSRTPTPASTETPSTPSPVPSATGTPGSSPTSTVTSTPGASATPSPTNEPTSTRTAPAPTPTSTPTATGDANCDGVVNAIDAALVLQFSVGLILPLPCFGAADVNGDGQINPVDATLVLQYVAGLLSSLPPG